MCLPSKNPYPICIFGVAVGRVARASRTLRKREWGTKAGSAPRAISALTYRIETINKFRDEGNVTGIVTY